MRSEPGVQLCHFTEDIDTKHHWLSVENSSSGLILRKKRATNGHFFSQKTGKKRATFEFFKKINGRFQNFLSHFFLWVFKVLLYLLVYLEIRLSITRPRKPLKLRFRRFNVTNYQHGLINVKCRQNHKKRAKSQKSGRFSQNARLNGHARLKTGDFSTLASRLTSTPLIRKNQNLGHKWKRNRPQHSAEMLLESRSSLTRRTCLLPTRSSLRLSSVTNVNLK